MIDSMITAVFLIVLMELMILFKNEGFPQVGLVFKNDI